jgi:hypothetical protein
VLIVYSVVPLALYRSILCPMYCTFLCTAWFFHNSLSRLFALQTLNLGSHSPTIQLCIRESEQVMNEKNIES